METLISSFALDFAKARVILCATPAERVRLWRSKSWLLCVALQYAAGYGLMSDPPQFTDRDRRQVRRFRKQCRIVRLLEKNFNLLDSVIASVAGASESLVRITRRSAGFEEVPVPF